MEARATGSCSGGFEGGRRQSRRRNKAGAQAFGRGSWMKKREGGLHGSPASGRCRRPLAELDGETRGGSAWKLEPLEAAAEVLKGTGGSLGGATTQEHSSEAFGRGSWTEKKKGGLHGS